MEKTQKQPNDDPSIFTMHGTASFADQVDDDGKIVLNLYDGSIQKHWYWGNLAFDLSKAKLYKKSIPILESHDTEARLGYSTGHSFEGGIVLEGQLLNNSARAAEIKSDSKEGFPFESSLRFDLDKSKILRIQEGETVEVNGQTMTGPGAVVDPVIMEGSVCTFGALSGTVTQIFKDQQLGESQMAEQKLTIEQLQKEHPDVYKSVFEKGVAEGEKKERDAFEAIKKVCPDGDISGQCFVEGKTPEQAEIAYLKKQNADKDAALAKAAEQKTPEKKEDDAGSEFEASDKPESKTGSEAEFDEEAATEEQLKERFSKDSKLQSQYMEAGDYVAYVMATRQGLVEIQEK